MEQAKPKLKPMCRLSKEQIEQKKLFFEAYAKASNPATASAVDANANVVTATVNTAGMEAYKDFCVQVNRSTMYDKILDMFGQEEADLYIDLLESHDFYKNDESPLHPATPYCVAITMHPFIEHGMIQLGGESKAPKHIDSYCGSFINLVFAISSQFAGAVATVEFLIYFDYFARKDWGEDYLNTHKDDVKSKFQHVVYSLNQPAAARGYQCVRETTELFTPEGFKKLGDLKEGDECYAWENGKLVKSTIDRLNVYDYDGDLIQFSGRNIQQTVTPNHRVLYKLNGKYLIKEAQELVGHTSLSIPVSANNDFQDYPIEDDMLELVAMTLTDGSFENKEPVEQRITFYMSETRRGYARLIEILDKYGYGYTDNITNAPVYGSAVHRVRLGKSDSLTIGRFLKWTKKEIPFFFTLLSQRQAKLVIKTWSATDGQGGLCGNGGFLLQCDNMEIANRLQQVVLLGGYGSEIMTSVSNKICGEGTTETIYVKGFRRQCKRVMEYKKVHYTGKVWCPSTKQGVVVFREENNIPYISGNSIFWNLSVFDEEYFNSIFGNLVYPNGSVPVYESIRKLQFYFMEWFTEERHRSLLTFPVLTESSLNNADGTPKDEEFARKIAEYRAGGLSFFSYNDTDAASLASCCRLRNGLDDDNEFAYTLGGVGVATGSTSVMTFNFNRLVQTALKDCLQQTQERVGHKSIHKYVEENPDKAESCIMERLSWILDHIYRFQKAHRELVEQAIRDRLLPAYSAGFIHTFQQFCTIGINGLNEGAEYLGYKVSNNDDYKNFVARVFGFISKKNKEAKKVYKIKYNCEIIPGENVGIKFASWDKKDGLEVPRDCYNSYIYLPEDTEISIPDKFQMHGKPFSDMADGGSALHLNLSQLPDAEFFYWLRCLAGKYGTTYWTTNVLETCCNDCGWNDFRTLDKCPKCGSTNLSFASRIIGYLRKIENYSEGRKIEHSKRFYH